ncbi:MAG: fatty acid desaturase [Planctomycetaceae bacterium]|jgi:acyl-lipid omega-6 desaturase (Delta-12 desaturase)|nr:fatty acid desaturase [Planctomycetaceae bacterium]MDC0273158.1 fatty acid desaturase [Planctomycetaceae bacterium]MDG2390087.1 fatty acid desaturase [Planctomycetaceae bacterium]
MPAEETEASQDGRKLLDAMRPFAEEYYIKSWWCLVSTLVILGAVLVLAAVLPWWPLRLAASIAGGLVLVRTFIIYHDYMHGSLLKGSRLARGVLYTIGLLMLSPPRHWRFAHNFHHAHVGKVIFPKEDEFPILISDIGSFPLMSTEKWRQASTWQRLRYRISRHPLTILCAYVTIFLIVSCIKPLVKKPRKYWDGAFSLLAHGGVILLLWLFAGFDVAMFSFVIPFAIASAVGAYFFYAQHAYEGLHILPTEEWTYSQGALESSSYMKLGPIMNWFTGNIGYHHIHHLNPHIPFYRVPEAMAAIPELQHPTTTSLRPGDILSCFRANLWDSRSQQMVSYRDASHSIEGRKC